jgi:hypothetical protein
MLLSAVGVADDEQPSNTERESLPGVMRSVDALHAMLATTSRSHLLQPVEAATYLDDWPRPIADIDFQDGSAMARVKKLRNLSLVTVAEIGRTRLFLGVNNDGLVGLHFNVFSRAGDERYLEVVRMPYLKDIEPDSAVSSPGAATKQ